jgi:hypothetical protein
MTDKMINGWVVVRLEPWDFHGPFPDQAVALKLAETLNSVPAKAGYQVKWGERPVSKLRDSELAFWKGAANDTKGGAVRSGIHGRPDNRKSKVRTGSRR